MAGKTKVATAVLFESLVTFLAALPSQAIRGPRALHRWDSVFSFQLSSPRVGWVVTQRNRTLLTTDDGRRWRDVTPPKMHAPHHGLGASFLDAEHGWVVRIGGPVGKAPSGPDWAIVWRTSDGGRTWDASRFALRSGNEWGGYGPILVRFTNPSDGWVAIAPFGHLEDYGADIARTSNGGLTW